MKWLAIVVLALPLGGCLTAQGPALPMALGPDNSDQAQCVRAGLPADTPAYGNCNAPADQH